MDIKISEGKTRGWARATINGEKAGVMTFSKPAEDHIVIDHTLVEEEARGEGVGQKLFYAVLDYVQEKHIKIVPVCPFARSMFKRYPETRHVLVNPEEFN